jgi:hypothetical protein
MGIVSSPGTTSRPTQTRPHKNKTTRLMGAAIYLNNLLETWRGKITPTFSAESNLEM